MEERDTQLIEKCKELIEEKLAWGKSEEWTKHDFETLSKRIMEATGTNLSVATLMRIWGKVKYENTPTLTTLDTLVRFLGIENWRVFSRESNGASKNGQGTKQNARLNYDRRIPKRAWHAFPVVAGIGAIIVVGVYILMGTRSDSRSTNTYLFSSKKVVSQGVPNSVIFDYDASGAQPSDSIFIQQSWDPSLRTKVSVNQRQHTSIYYTPGFYRAKLVVNDDVMKEHDLLITSGGWQGIIEGRQMPVYVDKNEITTNGILDLTITDKATDFANEEIPWVSFYNVQEFGVPSDNFIFEAEVQNYFSERSGKCQYSEIILLDKGSAIKIPLSIPGCVSNLTAMFIDQTIDGKKADLSSFGCDFSDWVTVRCEVKDRRGKFLINNHLALETEFNSVPNELVGVVIRFQGAGRIRNLRLLDREGNNKLG